MESDLIEALQIISAMNFGTEFEKSEKEVRDLEIGLIEKNE